MGCSPQRQIVYNKYENPSVDNIPAFLSGPFLRTNKHLYDNIEKYYQNKSYIEDFLQAVEKYKKLDCLGYRKPIEGNELEKKFTYFTYGELIDFSENIARNLVINKLTSKNNQLETEYEFLGIFARNCMEWVATDIACQLMGITSVTFYATLGDIAFEHICNQTRINTICVSPDSVDTLIKYRKRFDLRFVENVILFDVTQIVPLNIRDDLEKAGFNVYPFSMLSSQNSSDINFKLSKPDTTLTICYTSGTTSLPKGAELTQRNFIAQTVNCDNAGYNVGKDTVHLSYLPLAHVMERMCILLIILKGGRVGFLSGDIRKYLREDMQILKPTIFVAVPRVLNTFRQLVFDEFAKLPGGCKKSMVEKALRVKRQNFRENNKITDSWYDSLVFSKVREKFGGKIEVIITGSAPLTRDLAEDIKILFSIPIIEAYGMTECCGGCVVTHISDLSNESAGGCLETFKIKLVDVPEMNYHSKTLLNGEASPTGEICMKGPCIFKGYYLNPEETSKVIDSEGWLHTGDVGRILPRDQGLKIIDRVKEIFKLSQGEYIAPSKLESAYVKCKFVLQLCVYGDSTKSNIVGIIIPNQYNFTELVKSQGKWHEGSSKVEDFFNDKEILEAIRKDLENLAKENNFNSLEKLNNFVLTTREFTIDNGCLTPTMKLVRRKIAEDFRNEIITLYN